MGFFLIRGSPEGRKSVRIEMPGCLEISEWNFGLEYFFDAPGFFTDSAPHPFMNTNQEANPRSVPGGPREEQPFTPVLISGLITTALALAGVFLLARSSADINIMGWYADYVLPVGALIVGVVAASGYGLASWFSGIKITRSLLGIVLALQLFSYFGAQYIEFNRRHLVHGQDRTPVGFMEYYDRSARMMAWKNDQGVTGQPLGAWGYAVRALEVLGFVGGGLIVPLILWKSPYCETCKRYMRTRTLGWVPSSVPVKKIKKSDTAGRAAHQAEQQQAADQGQQTIESLKQMALGDQTGDFKKMIAELGVSKKQTMKLPARFSLHIIHCRRCFSGALVAKQLLGQGKQLKTSEYARAELHPEFVRSICQS
jgi:hypothetical protein